jgi:hypothetical protein
MEERRKAIRWNFDGAVSVKRVDYEEPEIYTQAGDISCGGIRFQSRVKYLPQTDLEVIIELPDEQRFVFTEGRVAWQQDLPIVREGQTLATGVSFSNLVDRDKERIFHYAFKFCNQELNKKWWAGLRPTEVKEDGK